MLSHVLFFIMFDNVIVSFVSLYNNVPYIHYCMYVCYIVVLWTILSLMPTTSQPKDIGGVC